MAGLPSILVTDAVGLIGKLIISCLAHEPTYKLLGPDSTTTPPIRAGYHSETQLTQMAQEWTNTQPVKPVLVDWNDESTYVAALQGVYRVLLLTPLSAKKVAHTQAWISAMQERVNSEAHQLHIVHVGVHCNTTDASDRCPHETWFLQAEDLLRAFAASHPGRVSVTLLRINFDGYNGVLRSDEVAYFVPANLRLGWIARDDIAAAAVRCLLDPVAHTDKAYPLATEVLSLEDMAEVAGRVCGRTISAVGRQPDEFGAMAGLVGGTPHLEPDVREYLESVQGMFRGLWIGRFLEHRKGFSEVFEAICGRKGVPFEEWLRGSPYRSLLGQQATM